MPSAGRLARLLDTAGMLWKLQAVQNLFEDSCELPMLTGEQESATINMN